MTLTPSKEGEEEPVDQILTLESDGDEEAAEETRKTPTLWEKSLLLTEQPDEYDSDDDPEYVPPAVIVDTDLEYDEVSSPCSILYETLYLNVSSYWMARATRSPTLRCRSSRLTPRRTPRS